MKSTIELVNCNGFQLQTTRKLHELLGIDLRTAKQYADSAPCVIAVGIEISQAEYIRNELHSIGAVANVINEDEEIITPASMPAVTDAQRSNEINNFQYGDRELIYRAWSEYSERDSIIRDANNKIQAKKNEIAALNSAIKKLNDEIDNNKRIKNTNGECVRPKYRPTPLFEFPEFNVLKWIFIVLTVVLFVVMLILVGVNPEFIENMASKINVNAGLFVWLGAPAIGLSGTLLFVIGYVIYFIIENHGYNKNQKRKTMSFDTSAAVKKATEFLNNLENTEHEIRDKKIKINTLENEVVEMQNRLAQLAPIENMLPIPNELRNANGLAFLLNYIDTGRAYTLKEAVNLYYQDLKDAKKMEELRKQTAYAQEQMMNSRITAENSRITAENSRITAEASIRAANAAERAASAASEAADYERLSYWDNLSYRNSKK